VLMAEIHDRMPVIISPENYTDWLNPSVTDMTRLHSLIAPYPQRFMEAYRVSTRVNSPANEGIELIERVTC